MYVCRHYRQTREIAKLSTILVRHPGKKVLSDIQVIMAWANGDGTVLDAAVQCTCIAHALYSLHRVSLILSGHDITVRWRLGFKFVFELFRGYELGCLHVTRWVYGCVLGIK